MKPYYLSLVMLSLSCNGQNNKTITEITTPALIAKPVQVSDYISRMCQDKQGNIWFGTNGDGACKYDGRTFTYYSIKQGFAGTAVRGILQDDKGDLWFATNGGVSRYNGRSFTNYTVKNGLPNNQVWSICRDKSGDIWLGTEGGVSRYSAATSSFIKFTIPVPVQIEGAYQAPKLISHIMQDKAGNIWFATNGGGVYRYDGKVLTNLSEKNGLCNNVVQCILEDKHGIFWFGTRFGGLSRYDGKTFTNFTVPDRSNNNYLLTSWKWPSSNFIWTMLEDKSGDIWIGTVGGSLCKFDGKAFIHYSAKDGIDRMHVQSLLEDTNGNLWIGCSGGAYRYNGQRFINFTKSNASQFSH